MDFSPSIYEHCAALIRRRPWDVSRDAELLYEGQATAFRLYRQRPIVVGVDIYNLEAEAYGAVISEPDGNGIPAVTEHPCSSVADMVRLPAFDARTAGRIPMMLAVGRRLQTTFPGADIRIPVSGPFSIAASLIGFDALLCAAYLEPVLTRDALCHLVQGQLGFCRAIRDAGLDIAFFESAAAPPLLSPGLFRTVELPALKQAMDGASVIVGHPVPCVIGGNTTLILDAILETGTQYVICPAPNETDQTAFMRIMEGHPEVMVRVNMRPDVTARGTWDAVRAEVDRAVAVIGSRRRACLGSGALPYETPPGVLRAIRNYLDGMTPIP